MIESSNKGKKGILVNLFPMERGLEPKTGILVRATSASFIVVMSEFQLAQFKRSTGKVNPIKSKQFKGYYLDVDLIEEALSIVEEIPVMAIDYEFNMQTVDPGVPNLINYDSIKEWALAMGMELYDSEKLRNEIPSEG